VRTQYVVGIYSNYVALKSRLRVTQDHWKWHHSTDRVRRYEFLLAFHSNCGAILYCLRDIATSWPKSWNFYTPPVFSAGSDPVGISRRCLILIKLEWLNYCVVKKIAVSISTGTWRTDRQTDGWTGRRTDEIALSISRVIVLTRDKKNSSESYRLTGPISMWCQQGLRIQGQGHRPRINITADQWTL